MGRHTDSHYTVGLCAGLWIEIEAQEERMRMQILTSGLEQARGLK